jgi:hypothetical protein
VISLFPYETETLVLTTAAGDVHQRISAELSGASQPGMANNLTGWIENNEFLLTIRLRRQHLFMPVVRGTIESTRNGSIVFLKYSLFPATRFLLLVWSIILPLTGCAIALHYKSFWLMGGAMLCLSIIYGVAWSNFKLHLRGTRQLLQTLFN